jgi:asparagine synthetase B (glutamine-hydrolysing)
VNAGTLAGKFRIESRVSLVDEDYVEKNLERVVAALCSANYLEVLTGILGLRAAEMAAEAGAKAIITGGGSDELFGGYDFAWKMFEPERLEENLLHVYRQSGIFECHREDAVCTSLGIEVRPAYYDTDLAELILSLPASERIEGLGTETITEKAILKRIARGLLPDGIVDARKAPFYRSTSIVGLFERVAERAMSERDAERWRAEALKKNPALARSMMMRGRGPVLVYKTFASIYPGLDDLPCPMGPPDYGAPDSYGRFYCFFGSPLLAGYRWRSACTEKW